MTDHPRLDRDESDAFAIDEDEIIRPEPRYDERSATEPVTAAGLTLLREHGHKFNSRAHFAKHVVAIEAEARQAAERERDQQERFKWAANERAEAAEKERNAAETRVAELRNLLRQAREAAGYSLTVEQDNAILAALSTDSDDKKGSDSNG